MNSDAPKDQQTDAATAIRDFIEGAKQALPEAEPEPKPEPPISTTKTGGGHVSHYRLPDGGVLRYVHTGGRITVEVRDQYRQTLLSTTVADRSR